MRGCGAAGHGAPAGGRAHGDTGVQLPGSQRSHLRYSPGRNEIWRQSTQTPSKGPHPAPLTSAPGWRQPGPRGGRRTRPSARRAGHCATRTSRRPQHRAGEPQTRRWDGRGQSPTVTHLVCGTGSQMQDSGEGERASDCRGQRGAGGPMAAARRPTELLCTVNTRHMPRARPALSPLSPRRPPCSAPIRPTALKGAPETGSSAPGHDHISTPETGLAAVPKVHLGLGGWGSSRTALLHVEKPRPPPMARPPHLVDAQGQELGASQNQQTRHAGHRYVRLGRPRRNKHKWEQR